MNLLSPRSWGIVMASLLVAGVGSLLGCENPSSKEVASMIAEPQGEGVTSLLRGIDYKVNGTRIDVGNHRIEVFPYVEQCTDSAADHVCGVRFDISTEGKKQPALSYGVVGTGKTQEAALQHAVQSWWAEFTVPLIVSLAGGNLDFEQSPIVVYPERWRFEALRRGDGLMAPRRCTDGSCLRSIRLSVINRRPRLFLCCS